LTTESRKNQTIESDLSYSPSPNLTKSNEKSTSAVELKNLATSLRSSTKKKDKDKLQAIPYESQASHDLSFFIQQQKDMGQTALISSQIRFVMFQFLFTSR
jgi:hypothetical protein